MSCRALVPAVLWLLCSSVALGDDLSVSVDLGETAGQPGEVVQIPVRATFEHPVRLLTLYFEFDAARLEFLEYTVEGSAASGADPLSIVYNIWGSERNGVFGIHSERNPSLSYRIPPGVDQSIGFLRFRIRAAAETGAAPVTLLSEYRARISNFTLDGDTSVPPDPLLPGAVEVVAPEGPRPVGNLHCEQFLDRIRLSFDLTESYDTLEVLRDGELVATLPGTAVEYDEPMGGVGAHDYSVVARVGGDASIAVGCEVLAVSPAAPPVEELTCSDSGRLSWTNPTGYDGLFVFRDGTLIETLPGTATSFRDPEADDTMTAYTVVGEVEGFRSPDTSCIANGIWILEVGDVQVPADATLIRVPVLVTTSFVVEGMDTFMHIDLETFELVPDIEAAIEGTVSHPEPEMFRIGLGYLGIPSAGIIWDLFPPYQPEKNLAPGLRQRVFDFIFTPRRELVAGEVFPLHIETGSFTLDGTTVPVDVFLDGEIRVGSAGPAAVKSLQAAVGSLPEGTGAGAAAGSSVLLSWKNGSAYDQVRVLRNGSLVAEVSGDDESFVDVEVPRGIFTYKVVGVRGDQQSFPASTLVATVSPPGTFLRGDATHNGVVDITDPVATLGFLFLGRAPLACDDAADADDDGYLTISDPIHTLTFLFLGGVVPRAPGVVFPWYDPTNDDLTCGE